MKMPTMDVMSQTPRAGLATGPLVAADCPPRPPLEARPLVNGQTALDLEALYKLLGNQTRLRILHSLIRAGELCVGEIALAIGMQSQAVSNQLRHLTDRNVVCARRCGNNIYYRVVDACVFEILDHGLCQLDCVNERNAGAGE